jgi:hypothetical protein
MAKPEATTEKSDMMWQNSMANNVEKSADDWTVTTDDTLNGEDTDWVRLFSINQQYVYF